MHFRHSPDLWSRFPELVPGVLFATGLHDRADVQRQVAAFQATAQERLEGVVSETELPEIQAWRRAFQRMGLKPTQYRCASESLLRRFRKEGALPPLHPLIDLCNAASLAFAIPVAVFDLAQVAQSLEVRAAVGTETYLSFGGATEHPEPGETIFADAQGNAHARRWTHRQSGLSAVRADTASVLIVAEAMHAGGRDDVARLLQALSEALRDALGATAQTALLTPAAPGFEFAG
ncbi:MAG: hypothetical protein EOO25_06725 [Comamonadaceae bacterium]|nr:MAG: hypothetical protein EOO25_06725 [Comamonadaceae bacterium]